MRIHTLGHPKNENSNRLIIMTKIRKLVPQRGCSV